MCLLACAQIVKALFKDAKMKNKMTLEDLKALFPPSLLGKPVKNATQKGAVHNHKPARKPVSGIITPAEYRQHHKGKNK